MKNVYAEGILLMKKEILLQHMEVIGVGNIRIRKDKMKEIYDEWDLVKDIAWFKRHNIEKEQAKKKGLKQKEFKYEKIE